MKITNPNQFTLWEPQNGWLVLVATKTNTETESGIILPDTTTVKSNQGICVKATDRDKDYFLGKECFFPTHEEYKLEDTETGHKILIIEADKVLMVREPSEETQKFTFRKTQGMTFQTIEHSK